MTQTQLDAMKASVDKAEQAERRAFAAMLAGDIDPGQWEIAIADRYTADAQYRYARQLVRK